MVTSNSMLLVSRTGGPGRAAGPCVGHHGAEAARVRRWWLALLVVLVLAAGAAGGTWALRSDGSPAATPSPTPTPLPSRTPLLTPAVEGAVTPGGLLAAL